ncbi:hypothetical protein BOW53_10825 [Solemya pervernicosa gill symbiont]|uniref:Uncharacterized protein n=1 Tax=Solemya pervernicosa gill symbiont TaxID=642797 RepID=A0A1T2L3I7_9GAMM|nr:hypothetical protein [Solemya pervernicosa gill symbiont]OOZ39629.1 hypothetical protein BOW53_10825 [Solemya pervernicosa gill symbiont]
MPKTNFRKNSDSPVSDKVIAHLTLEDAALYSNLLDHDDKGVNEMATRYLNGARELKRLFTSYERTWCKPAEKKNRDHGKFAEETREIFRLVMERISKEDHEFFSAVAAIQG